MSFYSNDKDILTQEELLKYKIQTIEELENLLINENFILILSNNENIEEIYKYTSNVIEDTKKIFNNSSAPIKLLFSPLEDLINLFDGLNIIQEENLPLAIEISNNNVKKISPLKEYEKQLSLLEMTTLMITEENEIEDIFDNGKETLLVLTDNINLLSELLPEPIKNIHMLYKHYFELNTTSHKIRILFSDKEDIFNLFPSNNEIPIPIVFKVDCTGTIKFPIHIKDIREDLKNSNIRHHNEIDLEKSKQFKEMLMKYKDIVDNLK